MRRSRRLIAVLCTFFSAAASAKAADAADENSVGYPVASELSASVYTRQFQKNYPNEEELKPVDPEKIRSSLVDKTLSVRTSSVRQSTNEDGVVVMRRYNSEQHLIYLAADGNARKFFGIDDVRPGAWEIAENKLITLLFKSKDPDGATRMIIRSYPLARFIRGIRDSRDGDYCQFGERSSHAIVMNYGRVSSRLAEACARRRP